MTAQPLPFKEHSCLSWIYRKPDSYLDQQSFAMWVTARHCSNAVKQPARLMKGARVTVIMVRHGNRNVALTEFAMPVPGYTVSAAMTLAAGSANTREVEKSVVVRSMANHCGFT